MLEIAECVKAKRADLCILNLGADTSMATGRLMYPTGKGGDYHEALKLARQTSMRSITRLIELRESADEQIATVASKALWEISWGKPKDYDPKAEEEQERPPFDPSLYSTEELRRMQEVMLMIARRQGLLLDEEGEDVAG